MFLENKYTKWYYSIIYHTSPDSSPYTETHHIIPKSLGGSDDKHNLVALSGRQHFVCHWLLTKMVEGEAKDRMVYALRLMCKRKLHNQKVTSRVYENTRAAHAVAMSKKHKGKKLSVQQIENLRTINTGRKWTEEQRARITSKLKWKGRYRDWETFDKIGRN